MLSTTPRRRWPVTENSGDPIVTIQTKFEKAFGVIMSEPVVLQQMDERGVVTITLNRPAVNNAYNGELVQGLLDAFAQIGADDRVRVVVIRGNGRHFQAGADLAWLKEVGGLSSQENLTASRHTAALVRGLNEFPKPTIALIHGACVGGGTGIAAACDIVIASEDASFAISEARWGVVAHVIFPQLNAAIGARNVRRYALTCERMTAVTAHDIGLVHEVCATGELDQAAAPVIEGLLMAGPQALIDTKQSVMQCAADVMTDEQFERLVQLHADKRQSDEAAEGLASFLDKRKPAWYREPGAHRESL